MMREDIQSMSEERRLWLPNSVKSPQFTLAMSALVVSILLYFHLKGFESWPDIQYRDIRFLTEFILIVLVIPALAYAFGSYYYTSAVITVRPECFQDESQELEDKELYVHVDGKAYSIKKEFPQLKIHLSRKGKHSVYLYDKKDNSYGSQEANTYEHHITYVEFKKKSNKSELTDTSKKSGQQGTPSTTSNSSKQNEKT